jgi:hyperosmotically inducible periplasmic protein
MRNAVAKEVGILFPVIYKNSRMAIVAMLACGVIACASGPRKSEAEQQADASTVNQVQDALNSDKELFSRHITVRADSGIVTLGGYAWTQPELEDAVRIAQAVPGVVKVVNSMELDRGGLSDSQVTR